MLGEDSKKNLPMLYELGCAFVGMEASVAFRDFTEKYEKQVTVEDILTGKLDKVKDWNINDHVAMIDKIIASEKFKEKATDKVIKNLAAYGMKMPAEATMKLWKLLGSQNVQNAVEFHKIAGNHIISIMTGGANQKK